jgi:hypothetical protein
MHSFLQVHEFGHHIHIVALPDCVYNATVATYNHSVKTSRAYTSGIYMARDVFEYMANAIQAWFEVRHGPSCKTQLQQGSVLLSAWLARPCPMLTPEENDTWQQYTTKC